MQSSNALKDSSATISRQSTALENSSLAMTKQSEALTNSSSVIVEQSQTLTRLSRTCGVLAVAGGVEAVGLVLAVLALIFH